MFRLRFILLVSVACLVASQETKPDGTSDTPTSSETSSPTDLPGSTTDMNTLVDISPSVQFETTPVTTETVNATSTEDASTTDNPGNTTAPSPSSATTMGVSVVSLALLALAVMS